IGRRAGGYILIPKLSILIRVGCATSGASSQYWSSSRSNYSRSSAAYCNRASRANKSPYSLYTPKSIIELKQAPSPGHVQDLRDVGRDACPTDLICVRNCTDPQRNRRCGSVEICRGA